MARLTAPAPADIDAKTQGALDAIAKQFGFAPSMFTMLAANPTVLEIVMGLQGSIAKLLDAKTRHTIALAVSQSNGCRYCQALHGFISSNLGGMSAGEIELARTGTSSDPKRAAVAKFAQQLIETRGQVSDEDLAVIREVGYIDPEIQAIVTIVVVTLLTNYLNNVSDTVADVPGADHQSAWLSSPSAAQTKETTTLNLDKLITKHLTRYFDPSKRIPEETFQQLLRYLRTSPTTINIQPNHFHVLETQDGKDKLADALVGRFEDNAEKVRNASHAIVFTTRKDIPDTHLQEIFEKERSDGRFADPEIQKGWEAGASNFVEIQTENYGGDVLHWLEKNTYLVVGATMMAAASLGVDATPLEGFDRTTVDAAFHLTDTDYTTTLLLVLGYPDEARVSRQPVSRFDAEKIFTRI